MQGRHEWRDAAVVRARTIAEDVRLIEFAVAGPMPRFTPGSHTTIEVEIDGAKAYRSYTCLPADPGFIRVAVRAHGNSRGGSRYMWSLIEGARTRLAVPENRFELSWRASSCLLVAGGIGITPIYGMARALKLKGVPVRLAYGARSREQMAFADELRALLGDDVEFFASNEGRRIDIAGEIRMLPADGELYICGPIGMLEDAKRCWAEAGRPASRLRFEVFGDSGAFAEQPFAVEVANCNIRVEVARDETLLEALHRAGVDMISECERGECGLCAVDVLSHDAAIDHRDVFFSEEEKKRGERMCSCVSRLTGGEAVIDVGYR